MRGSELSKRKTIVLTAIGVVLLGVTGFASAQSLRRFSASQCTKWAQDSNAHWKGRWCIATTTGGSTTGGTPAPATTPSTTTTTATPPPTTGTTTTAPTTTTTKTTTPTTTTTTTTPTTTPTTTTTTTTQTTTPSTTTTTAPPPTTTTTAPSTQSFSSATSYSAPSFSAKRVISVSSQSGFQTAWQNIQPGDEIDVHGVTFAGEVVLAGKTLSDWAEIHFDGSTKFVGVSGSQNLPAVWIHDVSHVRLYGGDVSGSAAGGQSGNGVLVHGPASYVSWWGFTIHDTGNTGLAAYPVNGVLDHLDFKGEISSWGHNLSWDPHAEKGTGLHGANLSDASYALTNSRFALYVHDGATGAGVEMGSPSAGATGNTLYLWCQNLSMRARVQVAGNCLQVWGANIRSNSVKYLEAENLQGRPYDANGMNGGQSLGSNVVEYGRASSTNLSPYLGSTEGAIPTSTKWDPRNGPTQFRDVSPTP